MTRRCVVAVLVLFAGFSTAWAEPTPVPRWADLSVSGVRLEDPASISSPFSVTAPLAEIVGDATGEGIRLGMSRAALVDRLGPGFSEQTVEHEVVLRYEVAAPDAFEFGFPYP